MQHLSGLFPKEMLVQLPFKEPILLGFLGGEPVCFCTWWDMLLFLVAWEVAKSLGILVSGMFGFWN